MQIFIDVDEERVEVAFGAADEPNLLFAETLPLQSTW
jgi:hypothetical protein